MKVEFAVPFVFVDEQARDRFIEVVEQVPIAAENESAPLSISGDASEGQIERRAPLDPQQATTYAEFIRAMRQVDNDRVIRAYKKFPVNVNIRRDEKRHEVDTPFQERGANDLGPDENTIPGRTLDDVNRQAFNRWHTAYWSEIDSE